MPKTPPHGLTVTGTTTVSDVVKPSTNQLIDRSVDESMENVLHQRRGDFRNAERDRDEYSDGAATSSLIPATTRGERLGSATKSTTSSMPKTPPLTGILTVTGTTTVSNRQTQYQPADRPGSVDESMENVLTQTQRFGTLSVTGRVL
jgi:hypothetical protein